MNEKDIKIIAVVGMCGSGKSTAIDYLTNKKIPKVYFGGILYKAMEEAGIERTPENENNFRREIREREGNDFVVKRAIKEVRNLISAGQRRIVLDGLYSWTEYKILRKEFPTEMSVIAIVAPKTLRRKRLTTRKERPYTMEEAASRDMHEIEDVEKGGPIAIADYYVDNSKDIKTFHEAFEATLKDLEFID